VEPTDFCPTGVWLSALRSQGRSPGTIASYANAVNLLRRWTGQHDLTGITRLQALSFTKHLTDEGRKPGGVMIIIRSLRAGWSWMHKEDLVESNVFARISVKVPDEPQRTATDGECEAMIEHARHNGKFRRRDVALLTLLIDTGMRRSEIGLIEIADIDLNGGTVHVRHSKTKPRVVPMTDRAHVAMARWLRQRGTAKGNLWNAADGPTMVNACVQRHSKGQLRPHAIRRRFATAWLERGGSEVGLMRICGWSTRSMIVTYTKATADSLAHTEFRRLMA
jgi:site-specific recombinase XerD